MFTHECIPTQAVEKNFAKTALIKIHTVLALNSVCFKRFHKSFSLDVFVQICFVKLLDVDLGIPVFVSFPIKTHVIHGLFGFYYSFLFGEILKCHLSIMHTIIASFLKARISNI